MLNVIIRKEVMTMFNLGIYVITLCLMGFLILSLILRQNKLSNLIVFSLPLGICPNLLLYFFLDKLSIQYNCFILYASFVVCLIILIICIIRKKICLINDVKKIPVYFIVILLFIFIKLFFASYTSYFDWSNWDEFSGWQVSPKIAVISESYEKIGYKKVMQAPLMIVNASMVYEISGITINQVRVFSPIYLVLTALFLYFALIKLNINRHVSSLLMLIFLTSAPEMLILAKTYYNNIICMFYTITGFWLIIYYLFFKEEIKNCMILPAILLSLAVLTRNEIFYLALAFFVVIFTLMKMFNDKKRERLILPFVIILVVQIIWNLFLRSYKFDIYNLIIITKEDFFSRFSPESLRSFLSNVQAQMFDTTGFYIFSMTYIFIVALIGLIYIVMRQKNKHNVVNYKFKFLTLISILILQILYLCLILATQFIVFQNFEYLLAASFSRYMLLVLPLSFISLGVIIQTIVYENKGEL